jgi:hypothetical protein
MSDPGSWAQTTLEGSKSAAMRYIIANLYNSIELGIGVSRSKPPTELTY